MVKFLHLTKTLGLMSLVYVDWSELHLNVLQKEVVEMTKAGVKGNLKRTYLIFSETKDSSQCH
jgi:hypothetical protein